MINGSAGLILGSVLAMTAMTTTPAGSSHQAIATFANHESGRDTDPKSNFWRNAPAIFLNNDNLGRVVPGHKTEVRSQWTAKNLYLLFICPYEQLNLKPNPSTTTETYELWNWDVAEVFVGSDFQNIRRYKEFEVSPQSEWIDLDVDLTKPHHEEGWVWNSGFEVAARIDRPGKIWYAFMRIPYAAIDSRPAAAGNQLRVNFYRSQGPDQKSIAWQPTMQSTFHVPESFGMLTLEKH